MVGVRGIELQVVVEALALACLGPARLSWLRCGNASASSLPLSSSPLMTSRRSVECKTTMVAGVRAGKWLKGDTKKEMRAIPTA